MLTQRPTVRRMAPIDVEFEIEQLNMGGTCRHQQRCGRRTRDRVRAEAKELLDALLPRYVASRIFAALLESAAVRTPPGAPL